MAHEVVDEREAAQHVARRARDVPLAHAAVVLALGDPHVLAVEGAHLSPRAMQKDSARLCKWAIELTTLAHVVVAAEEVVRSREDEAAVPLAQKRGVPRGCQGRECPHSAAARTGGAGGGARCARAASSASSTGSRQTSAPAPPRGGVVWWGRVATVQSGGTRKWTGRPAGVRLAVVCAPCVRRAAAAP